MPRPSTLSLALIVALASTSTSLGDIKSWNVAGGSWGSGGNWTPFGVPAPGDTVFIGNLTVAENAFVTMNMNATIAALSVSDGMVLDTELSQLTVTAGMVVSGKNVDDGVNFPSRLRVDNGPNAVDALTGSLTVTSGAWLELQGGTLQSLGQVDVDATSFLYGKGTINLLGAATPALRVDGSFAVAPGTLTINQGGAGRVDLDGTVAGEGSINLSDSELNPFQAAHLVINGTGLADRMDDDIFLSEASSLTMNLDEGWTLGPDALLDLYTLGPIVEAGRVNGSALTVEGRVEASGEEAWLIINAPTTFAPGSNVWVNLNDQMTIHETTIEGGTFEAYNGGVIDFVDATTLHGGTFITQSPTVSGGRILFKGVTTYNGDLVCEGFVAQENQASVVGPTTIVADTFDLDGQLGATTWTISNSMHVMADSLSNSNAFMGTLQLTGTLLGILTVDLTNPNAEWGGNGTFNLGGAGAIMTTRIAGSPFIAGGEVNITNAVQIAADTRFASAEVTFTTPTSRLRLPGSNTLDFATTFTGGGRIEVPSGASLDAESFSDLGATDLLLGGALHLRHDGGAYEGDSVSVDQMTFEPTATWTVEIGGYDAGLTYDQLLANGAPNQLGGLLDVRIGTQFGELFEPQVGDIFTIMMAPPASIVGTFANDPVSFVPGKVYEWSVGKETGEVAHIVTLRLDEITPCPADLNGDGLIDAADLAILLGAWGGCRDCGADLDGTSGVDAADLAILLGAWGACGY